MAHFLSLNLWIIVLFVLDRRTKVWHLRILLWTSTNLLHSEAFKFSSTWVCMPDSIRPDVTLPTHGEGWPFTTYSIKMGQKVQAWLGASYGSPNPSLMRPLWRESSRVSADGGSLHELKLEHHMTLMLRILLSTSIAKGFGEPKSLGTLKHIRGKWRFAGTVGTQSRHLSLPPDYMGWDVDPSMGPQVQVESPS